MPRKQVSARPSEIRQVRKRLQLSQPAFARLLGVSPETYRVWDSGRRRVPDPWLDKARAVLVRNDPERLWSLHGLANELGVHVRTLRDAARSGRLEVIYGNRVVFRNPVPKATLAAGRAFVQKYYKQSYSRFAIRPHAVAHTDAPPDWAVQLRELRRNLRLTQSQLAAHIGACGKAVIYQWECRKRKPSPVFWTRIATLLKRHGNR